MGDRIDLDRFYCPGCASAMDLALDDEWWGLMCPECGAEVEGGDAMPPTLRMVMDGSWTCDRWVGVDLSVYARLIIRAVLQEACDDAGSS